MIEPSHEVSDGARNSGGVGGDAASIKRGWGDLAESRARNAAVTCEDCFFRSRGLCALGLDSPCPTFRPDSPDGLVPPRQPVLLMRDRGEGTAVAQSAAQAA